MNAAQEKYVAAQKAEEEKREKARQEQLKALRASNRREMLWKVLKAMQDYASYTDYAAIVNQWVTEITDEDIVELDAQMIELLKTFEMLSQLNFNIKAMAPKQENIQKDTKKVAAVSPDKALGDFLKMMGW